MDRMIELQEVTLSSAGFCNNTVNLGGDTDTIATIVSGISGIYYGLNTISDRCLQNAERKEAIKEIATDFLRVINE